MDDSLEHATRLTYGNLATANKDAVMAKAMAKLGQPDVCKATEEIYGLRGFSIENAVDMHVKHIKGEIKKQVVIKLRDSDGNETSEVTDVMMPPNYSALRDFFQMVLPKQTTKVAVANFNMNSLLAEVEQEGFAPLEARIVGEVQNTDPPDDPDEYVPFADDEDDGDSDDEEDDDDDTDDE